MKANLKFRMLVVLLLALFSTTLYAQTQFRSNELVFSIISEENQEVEISDIEATGDVIIPSVVTFLGLDYKVVRLAEMCCYNNNKLISIEIPNTVIEIGSEAFSSCDELSTVVLSNNVANIGKEAFYGCSNLTSVKISDSKNDNIDKKGELGEYAFYYCNKLNSVELPNNIKQIGVRAFLGCANLESIKFPEGLTVIKAEAFDGCGLTSVVLPETLTTIGIYAFGSCKLTSIKIPKSVTFIYDGTCFTTTDVESIIVEEGNPIYDSRDNCNAIIETATNKLIKACKKTIIPKGVKTIGSRSYDELSSYSLIIPNTIQNIESEAFIRCKDFNVFVEDGEDILEFLKPGRCVINNLYLGRNIITSSAIEDVVIKNLSVGKAVSHLNPTDFIHNINNLESINVDKENSVYASPDNCNALISNADKTLILSSKNTIIPDDVEVIGDSAFFKSKIQNIIIPNSVKTIGKYAFYQSGLQYITIPENVRIIDDYAFYNSSLKSVSIREGVESIGYYAFAFSGLGKIVFYGTPSINKSFTRCSNVSEVISFSKTPKECMLVDPDYYVEGDYKQLNYVMFSYGKLKVPYGTKEVYASISDWSRFRNVEEFDASVGVDDIDFDESNEVVEVARYDITGKLLTQPQKGVNIVKMSNGSIKKVIVK